ncbi:MAG: phosphoglucosamine mutase, partial [Candidatus Moranbacteria bacterium]|nr:phosphoglucosamine mutase [Candidatus Moranbacteria bacterium]
MKYFGTDGIRRNNDFFTEQFLNNVCASVVSLVKRPVIVVARDPRTSGGFIEEILTAGLVKAGARVISLG